MLCVVCVCGVYRLVIGVGLAFVVCCMCMLFVPCGMTVVCYVSGVVCCLLSVCLLCLFDCVG